MSLDASNGKTVLTKRFSAKATTVTAKLMSVVSFLFSGTIRKMLQQDLADIRRAAEKT